MQWLLLIVLVFLLPEILSTVLDSRFGRAMAARLESGRGEESGAGHVERIRYLEGEVDRLSEDVRRLNEETEFFQKLLAERASPSSSGPAGSGPAPPKPGLPSGEHDD